MSVHKHPVSVMSIIADRQFSRAKAAFTTRRGVAWDEYNQYCSAILQYTRLVGNELPTWRNLCAYLTHEIRCSSAPHDELWLMNVRTFAVYKCDVIFTRKKFTVHNKTLLNRSGYGKLSFNRNKRMISTRKHKYFYNFH
jgi:hypothetical protein